LDAFWSGDRSIPPLQQKYRLGISQKKVVVLEHHDLKNVQFVPY
jgi:hypothetical protein